MVIFEPYVINLSIDSFKIPLYRIFVDASSPCRLLSYLHTIDANILTPCNSLKISNIIKGLFSHWVPLTRVLRLLT